MKSYNHPYWLLLVAIVPLLIFACLIYNEYLVIHSVLNDDSLYYWKVLSLVLLLTVVLQLSHLVYVRYASRLVASRDAWILIVKYLLLISFLYSCESKLFPNEIPDWMSDVSVFTLAGTFFMPVIFYALFILIIRYTQHLNSTSAFENFATALLPPFLIVFVILVIGPVFRSPEVAFLNHLEILVVAALVVMFLFFFFRGMYVFFRKKGREAWGSSFMWKFIFGLTLPVIGLYVNDSITGIENNSGLFGNFSSHWFYVTVILNGILLLIPNFQRPIYNLAKWLLLCCTFTFTVYFFIVFLPFLPIGVLLTLVVVGFLILTPTILLITQLKNMYESYEMLKKHYKGWKIATLGLISFLIIPVVFIIGLYGQKRNLANAMEYVFAPDYNKKYDINTSQIAYTIELLRLQQNRRAPVSEMQTPLISNLYNKIVLQHMTLTEEKIAKMEAVYFGELGDNELRGPGLENTADVVIKEVKKQSVFDLEKKCWKSTIDLQIENKTGSGLMEFRTVFALPPGAGIVNYYLDIEGKREPGILAEKKAATWIYNSIVNVNRDPGILFYKNDANVVFRVFPFAPRQTRLTGLEILHKEPFELTIGQHRIYLGEEAVQNYVPLNNESPVQYITTAQKKSLESIYRKPYLHFIVDNAMQNKMHYETFYSIMQKIYDENEEMQKGAKVSLANMYHATYAFDDNWQKDLIHSNQNGGFFLDRVIRKELSAHYYGGTATYPVFVIVSPALFKAVMENDYTDIAFTFPDNPYFYWAKIDGSLQQYSLLKPEKRFGEGKVVKEFHAGNMVKGYKHKQGDRFLQNNESGAFILHQGNIQIDEETIEKQDWHTLVAIHGKWMQMQLEPIKIQENWLAMVRASFLSQTMTPVTSFIALENEAQKIALLDKQKAALNANPILDAGEATMRMSEPGLWYLIILIPLFLLHRLRKK